MRRTYRLSLLAASALVLAACGDDAAAPAPEESVPLEDQTLVISNWDAYTPEGLVEAFEQETGVQVEFVNHTTNEDILGKIQAGNGAGFDVVFMSGPFVQTLVNNGWAAELDHSQIPNLDNLYPEATQLAYDPGNRHSVPYSWGTTGLCYRTDLVDGQVNSWSDLLDPAPSIRGKVTMLGTDRWLLQPALLSLGYSINTQDPAQIEEAKQLTIDAKQNLLAFDDTTFYSLLDSGDAALVHAWDGWCNYAADEHVEFVVPQEGSDVWTDVMVVLESSENKEAAHAFLNYVLEPTNHLGVAELVLYKVPNQAAMEQLDPALVEAYPNLGITPQELLSYEAEVDLGDAQTTWSQAVAEIKAA